MSCKVNLQARLEKLIEECKANLVDSKTHPQGSKSGIELFEKAMAQFADIRILESVLNIENDQAFNPYEHV